MAAPGERFRTQGKTELEPFWVGADRAVGTLWAPFLPLLEPYSETLFGNHAMHCAQPRFQTCCAHCFSTLLLGLGADAGGP